MAILLGQMGYNRKYLRTLFALAKVGAAIGEGSVGGTSFLADAVNSLLQRHSRALPCQFGFIDLCH